MSDLVQNLDLVNQVCVRAHTNSSFRKMLKLALERTVKPWESGSPHHPGSIVRRNLLNYVVGAISRNSVNLELQKQSMDEHLRNMGYKLVDLESSWDPGT